MITNAEMPAPESSLSVKPDGGLKVPTIREAQLEYARFGEGSIHQGYRDVIKALVGSGFREPIRNDSYGDALFLTDIMFEHTTKKVCMLTGSGAEGFVSVLQGSFEKMLQRIHGNGGSVRIIQMRDARYEPQTPGVPACLAKLMEKFRGTLEVALAKSSQPQNHFLTCDSQMLRKENFHKPISLDSSADEIKAKVYFDSPARASVAEEEFEVFWNILRPNK